MIDGLGRIVCKGLKVRCLTTNEARVLIYHKEDLLAVPTKVCLFHTQIREGIRRN